MRSLPFPTLLLPALLLAPAPLAAQDVSPREPVTGDATADAGLVSRAPGGEVRLVEDAQLNDGRASLRLLVTNRGAAPQPFGPDAVSITADGRPVTVATRATLLGLGTGGGGSARDTAQGRSVAALPVNGAGQTDVSGYTGGAGAVTGGVPDDSIGRAERAGGGGHVGAGAGPAYAAQLDAVLLKPGAVAAGGSASGQLFTDKLKRRPKQLDVAVTFAGTTHRFRIDAPR